MGSVDIPHDHLLEPHHQPIQTNCKPSSMGHRHYISTVYHSILVYPPSGAGAINITRGDLNRLEDDEYLNDTIIEFGLK